MTTVAVAYAAVRDRLIDLATELDDTDAERRVPCCPEWRVHDVYAHIAGVAADALAGRLDGVATDPWTAIQVAERADRSFSAVVDELRETAPIFDEGLAALEAGGRTIDPRLVIDAWTHEQDVRHALGRPGIAHGAAFAFVRGALAGALATAVDASGLGAVTWRDETSTERVLGSRPAGVMLVTDGFTFCRARLGRRSRPQLVELGWDRDPAPWLAVFAVFGPSPEAVDEPAP